jgi:hypothetical protein
MDEVGTFGRQAGDATVESCGGRLLYRGKWLKDGGERLEKKNHTTTCDWRKNIKINRDFFEPMKNNQVRKRTY